MPIISSSISKDENEISWECEIVDIMIGITAVYHIDSLLCIITAYCVVGGILKCVLAGLNRTDLCESLNGIS